MQITSYNAYEVFSNTVYVSTAFIREKRLVRSEVG